MGLRDVEEELGRGGEDVGGLELRDRLVGLSGVGQCRTLGKRGLQRQQEIKASQLQEVEARIRRLEPLEVEINGRFATGSPWPSEPVDISTPGTPLWLTWPEKIEPFW